MKKWFKYVIIVIIVLFSLVTSIFLFSKKSETKPIDNEIINDDDFTISLIKKTYKEGNYLISPYSIKVALNLINEGANGETKKEIEKVLEKTKVSKVDNIKNANALFIKETYKNLVKYDFTNTLSSKYSAEVLYDEFTSPLLINEWTKEKTNGMIEKVVDSISPDYVLAIINAIAMDAKWRITFECSHTNSEAFTSKSGNKLNVEMMHNYYKNTVKYYSENNVEGVIIPYVGNLEFIALMSEDNNKFISQLTKKKLDNLINSFKEASSKERLILSIPRFKYEYEINDFKSLLKNMGIKKAFNKNEADFDNIISKENLKLMGKDNLYIDTAVHKTFIDLNEEGTRAAAVTYFGFDTASALVEKDYEEIEIKFDKPFLYLIRDKNTNEIIFFGQVNEPNIYKEGTCTIS